VDAWKLKQERLTAEKSIGKPIFGCYKATLDLFQPGENRGGLRKGRGWRGLARGKKSWPRKKILELATKNTGNY
jgi:hypothetical protein